MFNRATFDPLLHEIKIPLEDGDAALRLVKDLIGNAHVQNQILHEYTHYFTNDSPVSRAIRALKTSSLLTILNAKRASRSELLKADNDWRVTETVIQYLLPIYEGLALIAEFDLCAAPFSEEPDIVFHHELLLLQTVGAISDSSINHQGFHSSITNFSQEENHILDAHLARISSDSFQSRKRMLLRMPLNYKEPDNCYLVAYLFCRQLHTLISSRIGKNVDVGFLIKYVRSFFLEDWGLVEKILSLDESESNDSQGILLQHLIERISTFFDKFDGKAYDAYRKSVLDLLYNVNEQHSETLQGLFQDGLDIPAISLRLLKAEMECVSREVEDDYLQRVLAAVQSRRINMPLYSGSFLTSVKDGLIFIESDKEIIQCKPTNEINLPRKTRQVSFYLSHLPHLPRSVRIENDNNSIYGWIGTEEEPGSIIPLMMAGEGGDNAKNLLEPVVEKITAYFDNNDPLNTKSTASEQACNLYRYFIDGSSGFGSMIKEIAKISGQDQAMKGTPVISLLRPFFSKEKYKEEFSHMVLQSSLYGIGYNIGYLVKPSQRPNFLDQRLFLPIFRAEDKIAKQGIDLQFYFVEDDKSGIYQNIIFQF